VVDKLKILCLFDGALHDIGYRFDRFLGIIKEDNWLGETFVKECIKIGPKSDFKMLHEYQVLFLFGISSSYILNEMQIEELRKFMHAGGGVFGSGDHDNLGLSLCGEVPRLKYMRNWSCNPAVNDHDRLTTMRPSGRLPNQDDQKDHIPQRIYPYIFSGNMPHYLLQFPLSASGTGFINFFPDHPHEGECFQPDMRSSLYKNNKNFPGNTKIKAVAKSMSAGSYVQGGFPAVTPREFISISVYDGHEAKDNQHPNGIGRLVADATWHHFLDINLVGFATSCDPTATAVYEGMKRYYKNIVTWLAPIKFKEESMRKLIIEALKRHPYAEVAPALGKDDSHSSIINHGRLIKETLGATLSPAELSCLIDDLIENSYEGKSNKRDLLQTIAERSRQFATEQDYINSEALLQDMVLGQAVFNYKNMREERSKSNVFDLDGVLENFEAFNNECSRNYFSI